jgi:hypothetical protein
MLRAISFAVRSFAEPRRRLERSTFADDDARDQITQIASCDPRHEKDERRFMSRPINACDQPHLLRDTCRRTSCGDAGVSAIRFRVDGFQLNPDSLCVAPPDCVDEEPRVSL